MSSLKFLIILQVVALNCRPIQSETDWTYEFVSFSSHSDAPDIFNINLYLTRISRGHFGISGTWDIFEDLNNDTIVSLECYYSYEGHNYARSPLQVPKMPWPKFVQTHYKDFLMEGFQKCSANAPDLEHDGVLTKRFIEFNNCYITNENMPSHLKSGYYRIVMTFMGQSRAVLECIAKIEPKD